MSYETYYSQHLFIPQVTVGSHRSVIVILILTLIANTCHAKQFQQLAEHKRRKEYTRRNHSWPPQDHEFTPQTDGWKELFRDRFQKIDYEMDPFDEKRYYAYLSSIRSALILPNFTEYGWGLTQAPPGLWEGLHGTLHRAIQHQQLRPENNNFGLIEHVANSTDDMTGPMFFYDQEVAYWTGVASRVMKPMMEAWSGLKLTPSFVYGMRVYPNNTKLHMHLDKTETHVISAIFHIYHGNNTDGGIDSSQQQEQPWPLVIEGLDGITNQVVLQQGDVLLYESAKCLHGRPTIYQGSGYSSLFVHYRPTDQTAKDVFDWETLEYSNHYRVPAHWKRGLWRDRNSGGATENDGQTTKNYMDAVDEFIPAYEFKDTGIYEPNCPSPTHWCAANDGVARELELDGSGTLPRQTKTKWIETQSPPYGKVLTGNGTIIDLKLDAADAAVKVHPFRRPASLANHEL